MIDLNHLLLFCPLSQFNIVVSYFDCIKLNCFCRSLKINFFVFHNSSALWSIRLPVFDLIYSINFFSSHSTFYYYFLKIRVETIFKIFVLDWFAHTAVIRKLPT